ncbi:ATP-binding protein [Clostridium sp. ZBS18]|uniref:ATP-binding protein n=1 Tax=Clostridium sp. ZBS18 TaxID=2949967 RepID=UPI00207933CE|nr:ATP-binding protein [Clostridium sp. ZBS18]
MKEAYRNLSDKEQALLKLPVFFDGYDNFYHPIRESVTNARDILINSEDGLIEVILHNDNQTVTIKDNGCGIVLDGESNGIPNWKHAFLILFSGSKMSTGGTSGGTNGCGNTIINYSSDLMDIVSKRNGKIYHIRFINGGDIEIPFECLGNTDEHGTEITFKLCDKIYTNTVFDENEAKAIVERIVVTSPNITSIFKYKNQEFKFNFKDLKSYFDYKEIDRKINDIILNEKEYENEYYDIDEKKNKIEKTKINLIINSTEDNMQYPFLNGIYMPQLDDNIIRDGVVTGMREIINTYIKDNSLYEKKEKQITKQDIIDTISYIVSIESTNVSYTSQTKFSTKKELYFTLLKQYIKDFMETYCIENKENIKVLTNKILISKRAREKSEVTRNKVSQELSKDVSTPKTRPKKFTPCVSKDKTKRRLALMEGNSALTPILKSRDKRYLALYALKGKIIGCIKNNIDDILDNQEIKDIFKILGCGMEYKNRVIKGIKKYCEEDLKYEEIDIMSDFDADGVGHIAPLVICMFYVLAPKIIENGHLYILNTPLYGINYKKEFYYAYSDSEKEEIIKRYNMDNSREVFRYKGLGSLSTQNLIDTAMNEENCVKDIVTMKSAESCYEAMMLCFSDDKKDERKLILETRGHEFTDMMEVQ